MTEIEKLERLKQQRAELERKIAAEETKLKERNKRDRDKKLAIIGGYYARGYDDIDADLAAGKFSAGFYRSLNKGQAKVLGIDLEKLLAQLDKVDAERMAARATKTPAAATNPPQSPVAPPAPQNRQQATTAPQQGLISRILGN
jgi:hypothetical protein